MNRRLVLLASTIGLAGVIIAAGPATAKCYKTLETLTTARTIDDGTSQDECHAHLGFAFKIFAANADSTWHCERGEKRVQLDNQMGCKDTVQPSKRDCADVDTYRTKTTDGGGCELPLVASDSGCAKRIVTDATTKPSAGPTTCQYPA